MKQRNVGVESSSIVSFELSIARCWINDAHNERFDSVEMRESCCEALEDRSGVSSSSTLVDSVRSRSVANETSSSALVVDG